MEELNFKDYVMWKRLFNLKTAVVAYSIILIAFGVLLYQIKSYQYDYHMDGLRTDDYMQCGSISIIVQSIEPELVAFGFSKELFDNYPEPKFIGAETYKLSWDSGEFLILYLDNGWLCGYNANGFYKYFY